MAKEYKPELGQALFGKPFNYFEFPDNAEDILRAVLQDICRALYKAGLPYNLEEEMYDSLPIDGIEYRNYCWDEDSPSPPNFSFDGVEISWYKYIGRGMSCNVDWKEKQWLDWFDKIMKHIREWENKNVPDSN